jgi:hypothetical protein
VQTVGIFRRVDTLRGRAARRPCHPPAATVAAMEQLRHTCEVCGHEEVLTPEGRLPGRLGSPAEDGRYGRYQPTDLPRLPDQSHRVVGGQSVTRRPARWLRGEGVIADAGPAPPVPPWPPVVPLGLVAPPPG